MSYDSFLMIMVTITYYAISRVYRDHIVSSENYHGTSTIVPS